MPEKYYITAAIPYANDNPHIGHAILFLYTDVIARYQRMLGKDVFYLIGTDEHGQKMLRTAQGKGREVLSYCNEKSAVFQNLADQWNISNNDFIRTTEDRHIQAAQKFWQASFDNGDIYKKSYSGLYCVGCEAYKTEKDLIDGKCPDHQKEPEVLEEENYFFKLSKYQKPLQDIFNQQKDFVFPNNRYNEMLNILNNGLEDVSISRSIDKLNWGVPVPNDPGQVMYVWFDALTNYISALGYGSDNNELFNKYWPADVHIIGKEINRFHSLLWPAMLMSAGLEIPKMIAAHGWITVDGQKMSKSIGNVIDPIDLANKYPIDAIRYFFMRELPFDSDGNYSEEKFIARYNGDLANGIGNLTNRITVMIDKYCEGTVPKSNTITEIKNATNEAIKNYHEKMEIFRFDHALEFTSELVAYCDQQISDFEPWKKYKEGDKDGVNKLLANLTEALKHIALMIYPITPETTEKIFAAIGFESKDILKKDYHKLWQWDMSDGSKVSLGNQLFPRI